MSEKYKTAELGDYLLLDNNLVKVVGISHGKTIHMEYVTEKDVCPHCQEEIGKKYVDMLESCLNFQGHVSPVNTIKL